MIYMKAGKQYVLVLEPSNLERLKNGEPLHTPDGEILVAYCPDIEWLANEMATIIDGKHQLDVAGFENVLERGQLQPTIYRSDAKTKRIF